MGFHRDARSSLATIGHAQVVLHSIQRENIQGRKRRIRAVGRPFYSFFLARLLFASCGSRFARQVVYVQDDLGAMVLMVREYG